MSSGDRTHASCRGGRKLHARPGDHPRGCAGDRNRPTDHARVSPSTGEGASSPAREPVAWLRAPARRARRRARKSGGDRVLCRRRYRDAHAVDDFAPAAQAGNHHRGAACWWLRGRRVEPLARDGSSCRPPNDPRNGAAHTRRQLDRGARLHAARWVQDRNARAGERTDVFDRDRGLRGAKRERARGVSAAYVNESGPE